MRKYDYIIWDFNGTLLDDVETGIWAVNKLLAERGLAGISGVEHYRRLFRFPIIEYYKDLGFDFEAESYEELAPKWLALYLERVKTATVYDDVFETLEAIKEQGIRQIVLSASELGMLDGQLRELGIRDNNEEVLGLDNIHAGSKLAIAEDWRDRHPDARALLIGDTDHDVDTARTLGADCVLIGRGHQSRESLEKIGVPVYPTLKDIHSIIK